MSALQSPALDREAARERIERILAGDEFRRDGSALGKWLDETLKEILQWLGDLLGIADQGSARVALLVFLGILALALVWILARMMSRRQRPPAGPATDARSPAAARAADVAELRRHARAAAHAGDHVAALRLYFRAIVIGLSERGDLRYRDAWTNRELLERGAPRREVVPLLAPLVPRLDAQSFGREPAGPEDVARLAGLCDRLLGGAGG